MPPGAAASVGVVRQEPGARPKRAAATHSRHRHESTTIRLSCACMVMLKREGWAVGKKRVYRLYRLEGLQLRMKVRRRKRIACCAVKVAPATAANQHWSMDFVHDQMHDGRKFRILTVIDQWSRESVSLEASFRLTGRCVGQALGPGRQTARMAAGDHRRQRHRVHLEGAGRLGLPTRRQARLHAARQAHGQRADRVIQRTAARRVPERQRVHHDATTCARS